MKGLVLAGGRGTRLRPLTYTRPKSLIPVANRPLIYHVLEDFRDAGITEVGVVLGNHGADAIRSYLGDGSRFGLDITYIVQGNPLGIAHAIACAEKFVSDEMFITYLSDNLLRDGIDRFVNAFESSTAPAGILLQDVDNPSEFGVAELDNQGVVRGLEEKPEIPPSSKALVGVYGFRPRVFDAIPELSLSNRGELEITELLETLLRWNGELYAETIEGWWKDTGRPKDLILANRLVLRQRMDQETSEEATSIPNSAEVSDSTRIHPPVVVGPNCTIEGGSIGPYTAIGADTTITSAKVSDSIIMSNVEIRTGKHISRSLIGEGARLTDDGSDTKAIVGDQAEIEL